MSDGPACCIYGNFTWPPTPDYAGVNPEAEKALGCVVIRCLKTGDFFRGRMASVPDSKSAKIGGVADPPNPLDDGNGPYSKTLEQSVWKDSFATQFPFPGTKRAIEGLK